MVYGNHADFEEMALENHPDSFLMIGKHKISEKTTLQDLKLMFPIEYNNYKSGDNHIFRLKFNADWDDELQIGIENGKASGIYYWTPC